MRHVIIGSGPAGVAAAESLRGQDPSGSITMVGDEPQGYYSRPGLAYFLTNEIPEKLLFPFTDEDFRRLGIQRYKERAIAIHPLARQVELSNQTVLPYDRLLIATGAEAVGMDLPGIQAEGVVKLDNLADAHRIIHLARHARTAVVVGGGITALELVEGLAARKVKVHYLLRGDRYWSNVLDETESRIIEQRLAEDGVQLHFNSELEEVIVKAGRMAGVRTKAGAAQPGAMIKAEILAVAIGVRPRLSLAKAAGIACERGILVNEYMETNLPGIYAAGDVAQVFDPFTGRSILDSLWHPARQQGGMAGRNMAVGSAPERSGEKIAYQKGVAMNVTRLARLTTTIIGSVGQGRDADLAGIARGDSEAWRYLPEAMIVHDNLEVNRLRLLVGKETLLGAIVMGDQTISRPLQDIIAHKVNIEPIRESLLAPGAPITKIMLDFWHSHH